METTNFCPSCGAKVVIPGPSCAGCGRVLSAADNNAEHLRLLSIFHYVVAALTALFGCFPIIHLVVGLAFVFGGDTMQDSRGHGPPAAFGWLFVAMASVMILTFWTLAGFLAAAARMLSQRRRHTFCIVVAALSCMLMPFGTVLGVFTLITLLKPEVKREFGT